MPLAFRSENREEIAFGFFNLETDMLLLDRYFLFADDFCDYIGRLAETKNDSIPGMDWPVYFIQDYRNVGDLMGAIHGFRYSGFIGDVYRHFPFPRRQEDFKQNPEGNKNRPVPVGLISRYSEKISIGFSADDAEQRVRIGELVFTKDVFQELILYVWLGGYPRWKDDRRPDYVLNMQEQVERSKNWLLKGMVFSEEKSW